MKILKLMKKIKIFYLQIQEIIDFLVANFVSGERWGGLFDIQASKRYEDWKVKKNQREYLFKRDVSKIVLEMEKQKVGAFFEKNRAKKNTPTQRKFVQNITRK